MISPKQIMFKQLWRTLKIDYGLLVRSPTPPIDDDFFNMVNSINNIYVGATTAWPCPLLKILFTRKLVYYLICVTYFEMKKRMSSVVCFEPGKVLFPHEEKVGPMVAVWIVPFLNGSKPHSNGYSGTKKRSYLYANNQTIEIVVVGSYNENL